jgi:hypothetical protein
MACLIGTTVLKWLIGDVFLATASSFGNAHTIKDET